jgi:hypothetical protein
MGIWLTLRMGMETPLADDASRRSGGECELQFAEKGRGEGLG